MPSKQVQGLILTGIIVLSLSVAPIGVSAMLDPGNSNPSEPLEDYSDYQVGESVDVWQGAPFTLTASGEAESFDVGKNILKNPDDFGGPIEKDPKIFDKGSTVSLQLEGSSPAYLDNFENEETELIVGKITPSSDVDVGNAPGTYGAAESLLTFDNANENVSFHAVDAGTIDNEELAVSYDLGTGENLSGSGEYVFFLATEEKDETITTDNDWNIDVDSNDEKPTVIGMTSVIVREGDGGSPLDDSGPIRPGENFTFDASVGGTNDVNQSLALYNESTIVNSENKYQLNETSTDIDSENITIETTIESVEGNTSFEGPVTVLGTTFYDAQFSGAYTAQGVMDMIVEEARDQTDINQDGPEVNVDGDDTLYASAAGENVTSPSDISVETGDDWKEGNYRYIYLAESGSEVYVETDTIVIETPTDGTDPDDGTGDQPADDEDDDQDDDGDGEAEEPPEEEPVDEPPEPKVADTLEEIEELVPDEVTLPETTNATRAEVNNVTVDPETNDSRVTFSNESGTESITFDQPTNGSTTVVEFDAAPAETGDPPGTSVSVSQISVPEPAQDSPATIRKRISQDRLSEIDATAEDLVVTRFNDEEAGWEFLDTEIVDETDQRVVLEAQTPGFSYFAVTAIDAPTAALDAPAEVRVGEEITFDASESVDDQSEIVAYHWTVDGESVEGDETLAYTFESSGDVTVEVTVENEAGKTTTETLDLTVLQQEEPTTTTETTEAPPTTQAPEPPEEEGSGLLALLGLIVVIVGAYGLYYYRQQ